jgi:hypothetical protein
MDLAKVWGWELGMATGKGKVLAMGWVQVLVREMGLLVCSSPV